MSIRGLPDERPRPSVANLIGRFEQRASKRQSSVGPGGSGASASPTASPSQSRSTSVVSHITGDSAVIEAKERREWPPQQFKNIYNNNFGSVTNGNGSVSGNDGLPTNAPSTTFSVADLRRSLEKTSVGDSMRAVVKSPPLNASDDVQAPPLSASVESEAKQDASISPPPSANSEPSAAEEVKPDAEGTQTATPVRAAGKVTASKSSIPSSTHSGARAITTGKTATTPRPSAITQSKSTSSTPSGAKTSTSTPSAARPLTAQRTGNSAASAAARARAGAKSPPVSTPSRAKTPTSRALRASTSGPHLKTATSAVADRAKTPTASPARAKTPTASASLSAVKHTPSSGLYAPTKASLARARNAEAPPPPVPKPAVSVSSLERLMKPTAASASKVRGPVPVPTSPPRAPPAGRNVKTMPTSPPTKGKTLKLRVGLAPARLKEERERKEKKEAAAVGASAAAAATAGTAAIVQPTSDDEHGHEHEHEQEQPSFISTTGLSDASLTHEKEHEEESDHAGPPSDIESYDDAFASDDERALELDQAHLVSARPSAEGDTEPFIGTLEVPEVLPLEEVSEAKVAAEEHESETAPAAEPAPASVEEEEVVQVVPHSEPESEFVEELAVSGSGPAKSEAESESEAGLPAQIEDSPIGHESEPKIEAEAIGPATPTASTLKQNGLSIAPEPETTEFDNVLNMLAVKPPASPVSIPDEEL
ncbi:hypothetical protein ACEPAH_7988 [Sanghuangporus vaninii]